MGESDIEVVRRVYEAMATEDLKQLFELLTRSVSSRRTLGCPGVVGTSGTTASSPSGWP